MSKQYLLKRFIISLILTGQTSLTAIAGNLSARLSSESVTAGESLNLEITAEGSYNANMPELPDIPGVKILGQSTSSSFRSGGGQFVKSTTWIYTLMAEKAGEYTIPPVSLNLDGSIRQTPELNFTAKPPSGSIRNDDETMPQIFVERKLSHNEIWEGQPVIATTKLYYRVRVTSASRNTEKSPDFQIQELEKKETQNVFGGKAYQVIELPSLLIPLRTGLLTIPSDGFRLQYPGQQSRRRPGQGGMFDFFENFGAYHLEEKSIAVQAETLTVRPLPAAGKPQNFSGLTGNFTLSASVNPRSLKQGETATLTIKVSGYGYLGGMKTPELPVPDGLRVYPDKPEISERADPEKGLYSKRTLKYALVPSRGGTVRLGPFRLSVFNPEKGSYETIETDLGSLEAEGVTEEPRIIAGGSLSPQTTQSAVSTIATDLTDLHRSADMKSHHHLSRSLLIQALCVILSLLTAMGSLFLRSKFRTRGSEQGLRKKSTGAARRYFRQRNMLDKRIQKHEEDQTSSSDLFRLIREYLGDKFGLPNTTLTLRDIDRIFEQKQLSGASHQAMQRLWEELDRLTYGGKSVSRDKKQELIRQADALIGDIEKQC